MIDKELEEKRIEAEARRQEAQRQHELRLLSTVAQQMGNILKVYQSKKLTANCPRIGTFLTARSSQSFNTSPFSARCDAVASVVSDASDKPHQVNGCSHDDYPNAAVYSNI